MSRESQIEDYELIGSDFGDCIIKHARVERLWTGGRWCEGPAWFGAGRYLLWSDIPNNRIMRWDECSGEVAEFRNPSANSNGNTVDNYGRLITCEHLERRVTRTEFDGSVTVIADRYDGHSLNSPNDVVVKSDDSIWFTDPDYGILSDYEGERAQPEIGNCNVFRVDADGSIELVVGDMLKPNGLAFSPDENYLYVSDTGATEVPAGPRHIIRYELDDSGLPAGTGAVLAECSEGLFDGFRFDTDYRIWASAEDGVHCLDRSGRLIGKILIPETVANLTFGGKHRNRLFICATSSLYAVYLPVNGASVG